MLGIKIRIIDIIFIAIFIFLIVNHTPHFSESLRDKIAVILGILGIIMFIVYIILNIVNRKRQ